jgi:hypothetical protein
MSEQGPTPAVQSWSGEWREAACARARTFGCCPTPDLHNDGSDRCWASINPETEWLPPIVLGCRPEKAAAWLR